MINRLVTDWLGMDFRAARAHLGAVQPKKKRTTSGKRDHESEQTKEGEVLRHWPGSVMAAITSLTAFLPAADRSYWVTCPPVGVRRARVAGSVKITPVACSASCRWTGLDGEGAIRRTGVAYCGWGRKAVPGAWDPNSQLPAAPFQTSE
ncbi:hypothetical protein MAPG_01172 [Magnaporthiopsis poae ATCC 64411]|uniref:Uncharacterized protein n=1 Tax=Magnaporthiopsis poae (strain ATCC 64411 / 73-15) TaxID=644358 RepID=A0A0C4DN00_MAGP6|nr:hypothetical protein MAPG_01172 [Magnaporthiopsis poae ATCC 64411]